MNEFWIISGLVYMAVAIITAFWLDSPKVEDWIEPNIATGKAGKAADVLGFIISSLAWPVLLCVCVKFWIDMFRINRAFKIQHK